MIVWTKDIEDLPRWLLSAALVIGVHLAFASMFVRWREPAIGFEGNQAIVVEFTTVTQAQAQTDNDLARGPLQDHAEPAPLLDRPKPQQLPEEPKEKAERQTTIPDPAVQLPPPPTKAPEKPNRALPPREITAPPRLRPSPAQTASWHSRIAQQLERHKNYPLTARERRQTGTAELGFTIDRQGWVVASRVVRSSGFAALDQESIATVKRAQPFPPPPANIPGEAFSFTVPIRFNIRDERRTP